ncbi:MAG: phytanoyl-CoA dioxygenase family protein [Chitinophagales bacterium]
MITCLDAELQHQLDQQGYVLMPFLPSQTITKFKTLYNQYFKADAPFYSSSFHNDLSLKKKLSDIILQELHPLLDQVVCDVRWLGASFLEKPAGEHFAMPIHQDWTVTDEERFGSFTFWIPLQDTSAQHGAMQVIAGSHNIEAVLRAPSLPVAFDAQRKWMNSYLKTIPMKAGTAMLFNQKLMHASLPNFSDQGRLALTVGLVPKEAKLRMYYFDKSRSEISQYAMPDDLFLRYPEVINGPGIGELEKTLPYTPTVFSEAELRVKLDALKRSFMQPLFANREHQEFFESKGYLIVQALNEDDRETLRRFLFESGIKKESPYGFYVGMDHDDKSLVRKMMEVVKQVALPKVAPYLLPHQLITASYVIKDPNEKGIVPPHQDWTFVEDEDRHCSVTCWIALEDMTMKNGCMGVLKGSNSFFRNVRPSPSPQVPSPLAKHLFHIFPYLHLLEMKAGEALFFDNRTIHASPPNLSEQPRLAVGLSITQADAELRHYFLKPGTKDRLLKYKVNPTFFQQYDNGMLSKMYDAGQLPEGYELMEEIPYQWEDWSKSQFEERLKAAGNVYNEPLTKELKRIFASQMRNGVMERVKSLWQRIKL